MFAVNYRAKPHQLALLIQKSLDDIIGTQLSACDATLQYQNYNIRFSLIYALFAECSIGTIKEICILHYISIKIAFACLLKIECHTKL